MICTLLYAHRSDKGIIDEPPEVVENAKDLPDAMIQRQNKIQVMVTPLFLDTYL